MLGARKWIDIYTPRGNLAVQLCCAGLGACSSLIGNVVQICENGSECLMDIFLANVEVMQGLLLGKWGSPSLSDAVQDPAGKLTCIAQKVASAT